MQEMNNNMIVLRKDYDSLLSNTYKNTNQIRDQDVIVNNLERNSKELRGIFED